MSVIMSRMHPYPHQDEMHVQTSFPLFPNSCDLMLNWFWYSSCSSVLRTSTRTLRKRTMCIRSIYTVVPCPSEYGTYIENGPRGYTYTVYTVASGKINSSCCVRGSGTYASTPKVHAY